MRPYRRQLLVLVPLLGVVALVAQVAGVGTTERSHHAKKQRTVTLSVIPGGSVPDVGSTSVDATTVRADEGEVVRMHSKVQVRAARLERDATAQVVCGIRYSRDDDASWTLGTPYETVVLDHRGAKETVEIDRSFAAPAKDRYRMSISCHVASPEAGATVTGRGRISAHLGLPEGAATPVE
ncbi:MAG: hypothetical protein KDC46_10680 [Thermoleophilia bacterium]|nr:hypothetical protein [Thermoleophilia bacterium]